MGAGAQPGSKSYERRLDTAVRDARCCELRQQGLSYRQIGEAEGLSPSSAHAAVKRALAEVVRDAAGSLRDIESDRLDGLWQASLAVLQREHPLVQQGRVVRGDDGQPMSDDMPRLAAVDRLVKIMERRAKLLGLDAPVETKVTVTDALDARIERLVAEHDLVAGSADRAEAGAGDPA